MDCNLGSGEKTVLGIKREQRTNIQHISGTLDIVSLPVIWS